MRNRYFFKLDDLVEAYRRHGMVSKAAEELDLPYDVAYRALRKYAPDEKYNRKYHKLDAATQAAIRERFEAGASIRSIADGLGLPYSTVHLFLTREGLHNPQPRS